MRFKLLRLLLFFLLFVLFAPQVTKAEGELRIGALEFHPYLTLKDKYSDNIYFTSTGAKQDRILTTIPGIKLLLPFRAHELALGYNAIIEEYSKYDSESVTDHNANALLNFELGNNWGVKLSDIYADKHESRSESATGDREEYEVNKAGSSVTYKLEDISKVQLDYTKSNYDFKTSQFRDRDEELISGYIYYNFLPRTSAFVEYDHGNVDFDSDSDTTLDNKVDSGLLGLTWELEKKSKGTIKGGYLWKDFDAYDTEKVGVWEVSLDHGFTDYTSILLRGQRMVNESSLQDTRYYITTGSYGEFTHKFIDTVSGVLRGAYGTDDFSNALPSETETREDKTYTTGAGLKYLFRYWLTLSFDFNYTSRNSNIDVNDFIERSYAITMNSAL